MYNNFQFDPKTNHWIQKKIADISDQTVTKHFAPSITAQTFIDYKDKGFHPWTPECIMHRIKLSDMSKISVCYVLLHFIFDYSYF